MKKKTKEEKHNNNKSFYFEDYTETESIISNVSNLTAKILPSRVTFIFFVYLSLIFIFCLKIVYISFSKDNLFISENNIERSTQILRSDIIDRNNVILARSINGYSAGIQPKLIKNRNVPKS